MDPIIENVTMAKRLWNKCKYERTQALFTPFVVCLAAGTLEIDAFLHYMLQDVHILRTFAQLYKTAEECADDADAKLKIHKLQKNVPQKFKLLDSFLESLTFTHPVEVIPDTATAIYMDFLLATASGKVEGIKAPGQLAVTPLEKTKLAPYILGVMTPRMRFYAFLGKELQPLLDPSKGIHPNQKWIDSISSDNFQAEAMQTEDLLEKLSMSLSEEERHIIEKLYHQAMELEVKFLLAQPLVQDTIVPLSGKCNPAEHHLMLFSSFDLTCTVLDSSSILAELAILTSPILDQTQSKDHHDQISAAHVRSTWKEIYEKYTDEYKQCIDSILVGNKTEIYDHEGLSKAIQLISVILKEANSRVIGLEVLKGLRVEDITRAGECMILQDGCMNFFHSTINNEKFNTNIHVISCCWCGDLIRSAFSSGDLACVNVHANELIYNNSISTGEITRKVESPIDKVEAFDDILKNCSNDQKNLRVYIGNTVGDLLCLLRADIGIVLGSCSCLRRLGVHFGVSFVPFFPFLVEEQRRVFQDQDLPDLKDRKVLYTASSWAEIHAFILGDFHS